MIARFRHAVTRVTETPEGVRARLRPVAERLAELRVTLDFVGPELFDHLSRGVLLEAGLEFGGVSARSSAES